VWIATNFLKYFSVNRVKNANFPGFIVSGFCQVTYSQFLNIPGYRHSIRRNCGDADAAGFLVPFLIALHKKLPHT